MRSNSCEVLVLAVEEIVDVVAGNLGEREAVLDGAVGGIGSVV